MRYPLHLSTYESLELPIYTRCSYRYHASLWGLSTCDGKVFTFNLSTKTVLNGPSRVGAKFQRSCRVLMGYFPRLNFLTERYLFSFAILQSQINPYLMLLSFQVTRLMKVFTCIQDVLLWDLLDVFKINACILEVTLSNWFY